MEEKKLNRQETKCGGIYPMGTASCGYVDNEWHCDCRSTILRKNYELKFILVCTVKKHNLHLNKQLTASELHMLKQFQPQWSFAGYKMPQAKTLKERFFKDICNDGVDLLCYFLLFTSICFSQCFILTYTSTLFARYLLHLSFPQCSVLCCSLSLALYH